MDMRRSRAYRPGHGPVEVMEPRLALSGIIASLATTPRANHPARAAAGTSVHALAGVGGQNPAFLTNQFLQPTGTPTPKELRREYFRFTFVGPYSGGPGQFSDVKSSVYIRGEGRSTIILHGDLQLKAIVPTDPTRPTSGQLTIFDRNINANTVVGLDLLGSTADLDRRGRPTHLKFQTDPNVSSGIAVESLSSGTVDIRYRPGRGGIHGVADTGTASVVIQGTFYTLGTSNLLRNVAINP